ncbi:MAG TPA: hypothetical protein VMR28_00795 [Candidatus Saccharimonadales bacterium]|nr:hypothetical protein [Candidatus Saccharimonadales bacterium]
MVKKRSSTIYNARLKVHTHPIRVSALSILIINGAIFALLFGFIGSNYHPSSSAINQDYTVPSSIPDDCSVDNTAALQSWLTSLPANATANFPVNGCYLVQGNYLLLHGTIGLTINGNGSFFKRTNPTIIENNDANVPLLFLVQNTNLTINNLGLDGGYNGMKYGGVGFEGHYGLLLESNNGLTMNGLNVNNVGGDFINLQFRDKRFDSSNALNTNILVTNSNFNTAGYHGITIESADGVTFSHDVFTNISVDAMDFEYDTYSTPFVNGQPVIAAEDNINIIDNVWNNDRYDWFASLQGQHPGVQEDNIVLSGNTITTAEPIMKVIGTNESSYAQPGWFDGLTFTNNTILAPAVATGVSGGSISKAFSDSTMEIKNVANVNISNNVMPVYDGGVHYYPNHPYLGVISAAGINGLTIKNNNFSGALGVLNPNSNTNTGIDTCNNLYLVNGAQVDQACNAPPTCPPGDTGTPPNCIPPKSTCPAGDTGTYPDCLAPLSGGGGSGSGGNHTTQVLSPLSPLGKSIQDPITAPNILVGLPPGTNVAQIIKVGYYIDDKLIDTESTAPFTLNYNTSHLDNGCHVLTTTIYKSDGTISSSNRNLCIEHKTSKTPYFKTTTFKVELLAAALVVSGIIVAFVIIRHRQLPWIDRFKNKKPPNPNVVVG